MIRLLLALVLLVLALTLPLYGQSAAVPALPVPIPALAVAQPPSVPITITVPKNGGKVTFTVPGQTLHSTAATTTTAPVAAPITIGTVTLTWTCPNVPLLPSGQPDLTKPLTCTAAAVVK